MNIKKVGISANVMLGTTLVGSIAALAVVINSNIANKKWIINGLIAGISLHIAAILILNIALYKKNKLIEQAKQQELENQIQVLKTQISAKDLELEQQTLQSLQDNTKLTKQLEKSENDAAQLSEEQKTKKQELQDKIIELQSTIQQQEQKEQALMEQLTPLQKKFDELNLADLVEHEHTPRTPSLISPATSGYDSDNSQEYEHNSSEGDNALEFESSFNITQNTKDHTPQDPVLALIDENIKFKKEIQELQTQLQNKQSAKGVDRDEMQSAYNLLQGQHNDLKEKNQTLQKANDSLTQEMEELQAPLQEEQYLPKVNGNNSASKYYSLGGFPDNEFSQNSPTPTTATLQIEKDNLALVLEGQSNELNEEIIRLKNAKYKLSEEKDELSNKAQAQITELEQKIQEFSEYQETTTALLESSKNENNKLKKLQQQNSEEQTELNIQNKKLLTQHKKLLTQNKKLSAQVVPLSKKIEELSSELDGQQGEYNNEIQSRDNEIKSLQEQIQQLESKNTENENTHKDEIDNLKDTIGQLQAELSTANTHTKEMKVKIDQLEKNIEYIKENIARLIIEFFPNLSEEEIQQISEELLSKTQGTEISEASLDHNRTVQHMSKSNFNRSLNYI